MQLDAVPHRCRTVSRDALTDRNILCRRRAPALVEWQGATWSFELQPSRHENAGECAWVEIDWGGARLFVGCPAGTIDEIARRAVGVKSLAGLPLETTLAVIEFAGTQFARALEAASRKHVRVAGTPHAVTGETLEAFTWISQCEGRELQGPLLLDDAARRYLASVMRERPCAAGTADDWIRLPATVRLVAGWADLSASAVAALGLRDVVLLDECFIGAGESLLALLGPNVGFRCNLKGAAMEALESVGEILPDAHEEQDGGDASVQIDDLPVRLTFDMGERTVSFAELRTLQPGYLFNLGRDPRSTVSIRANGQLIGEGELVDIEGRIGVSIVRLRAAA
jgi:type III secretion protein Q